MLWRKKGWGMNQNDDEHSDQPIMLEELASHHGRNVMASCFLMCCVLGQVTLYSMAVCRLCMYKYVLYWFDATT